MSTKLKLTPHETVTIVRSVTDVLEVEAVYGPGGSAPPAHLHPSQDEHFQVLFGELTARVDGGDDRKRGPGETLNIARGVKHQLWNASSDQTVVRGETRPAGRTEQWFRAIDRLVREAGGGTPGPLAFGALLSEYGDVFRLAVAPDPVVRPVVGALGLIGRLRGHRA